MSKHSDWASPPNTTTPPRTKERACAPGDPVDIHALVEAGEPIILRGLFADRPLVRAGLASPAEAMAHIAQFDAGKPIVSYTAAASAGGRFFYNDDIDGLNFTTSMVSSTEFFARLDLSDQENEPDANYIGSTDLDLYFPGLRDENRLSLDGEIFEKYRPVTSIWMGDRTTAAAHFDISNNAACCMVGRRRFTLFPPDQVDNLYPGPLHPTPGGQVVSMVDLTAPDFGRFPRAATALANAQIAELEPGDMLVYPALWWHQVEALGAFNVLVNFWWNAAEPFLDSPMTTLLHGLLSVRDRPEQERTAWRHLFDYYVFGTPERPADHLPPHAQGPLAPLDASAARRLRAMVINKLNR